MEFFLKEFNQLDNFELYEILKLRSEIFVVEPIVSNNDLDDKDKLFHHLFFKDNNEIVTYLRSIPENISYEDVAIGGVGVRKFCIGKEFQKY